jgi:hypothetical protein
MRLVQTKKGYLQNVNAESVIQNMSFGEVLFRIHANSSAMPTGVLSIINHYIQDDERVGRTALTEPKLCFIFKMSCEIRFFVRTYTETFKGKKGR